MSEGAYNKLENSHLASYSMQCWSKYVLHLLVLNKASNVTIKRKLCVCVGGGGGGEAYNSIY